MRDSNPSQDYRNPDKKTHKFIPASSHGSGIKIDFRHGLKSKRLPTRFHSEIVHLELFISGVKLKLGASDVRGGGGGVRAGFSGGIPMIS